MNNAQKPLAARLRPESSSNFIGQGHLLGSNMPLHKALVTGQLHSMILWGPPGCGKTTLARLLAKQAKAHMALLSAVQAGVKDIRQIADAAQQRLPEATVLFIDEIHRFNKSQQDALLPYVEEGLLTMIGATTENPSFELNSALLSRCRIYVLKRLTEADILQILQHALKDSELGLGNKDWEFPLPLLTQLAVAADGDARRALNLLEMATDLAQPEGKITEEIILTVLQGRLRRFDKGGDIFYEQISALHKAVRGSAVDAALYWFARMLDGGCDPLYIARRVVRMATEDIGNADPRALALALQAWDVQERLGSPEGELAIAQAVVYMACAAKSNAVYVAFKAAKDDVAKYGSLEVPHHLRNAPTGLMRQLDYGKDYHYAHDYPDAYVPNEQYFPDTMGNRQYYFPVNRGLEIQIKEKLAKLRTMDEVANKE